MKKGLIIILLITLASLLAPFLSPYSPTDYNLAEKLLPPSSNHILGTDMLGVDVFSYLLHGARLSLSVSLSVVLLSALIGLLIGSLAGFFGSWIEEAVMRFIDMLYAFPSFLLALSLIAFLGPSVPNMILALCITGWTSYARLVRAEIKNLKQREFVSSARAQGASNWRILVFHIWPNLASILFVQMTFGISGTIVSEAGLSFLGLGAPPEVPSWGAMLNSGRKYLISAPHVSIFSGLAIVLLVMSINFVGEDLRRKFNPKA